MKTLLLLFCLFCITNCIGQTTHTVKDTVYVMYDSTVLPHWCPFNCPFEGMYVYYSKTKDSNERGAEQLHFKNPMWNHEYCKKYYRKEQLFARL